MAYVALELIPRGDVDPVRVACGLVKNSVCTPYLLSDTGCASATPYRVKDRKTGIK